MKNLKEFSLLKQTQTYVVKYANVISDVLNIDIEIVDNNLLRIAGTGIYSLEVDRQCEGMSYKNVIKTGEHRIILEPVKDECCRECKLRESCKEVLEIATPIFYNDEIIGVIGLVCLDVEQKNRILKNVEENLRFLDNISELISSKVYEEFRVKNENDFLLILDKFITNINLGVVILSDENKIFDLNESALKYLIIHNKDINENIQSLRGKSFDLSKYKNEGKLIPINIGKYENLFIFEKSKIIDKIHKKETKKVEGVDRLVGESKAILGIKNKVKKIAQSTSTVLITGESGTGKDVLARAIHESSDRSDKPFIAINCAAIPEALLESELFGYAKGAFSGASAHGRIGKFELANKGVIFLDEIGDMPIHLQAKLLRVIQDRRCIRIGSNNVIDLDIRIIAATNKNLKKLVEENKFREDLYYRLNVIPIEIPPLRDRESDIELLMSRFIDKYNKELNIDKKEIDQGVVKKIRDYNWPGNIRELENCVEYMINISKDEERIIEEFLPDTIYNYNKSCEIADILLEELTLDELEKRYIAMMIQKYGSDLKAKKMISDKLGIGIATLYRKLDREKMS
ncbi:MAG: sigma 54-interacting transcriptional regulator [Clostridium perfringens]|nr:sigma 54-interacting transcriptional regulator [Clostridium perfringens]